MSARLTAAVLVAVFAILSCREELSSGVGGTHRSVFARLPGETGVVATADVGRLTDEVFAQLGKLLGASGTDDETRRDMGDLLRRRIGIDLLKLTKVTFFASTGEEFGLLAVGALDFQPPAGESRIREGVSMSLVEGEIWAAKLPDGLVVGSAGAVEGVIDVAKGKRAALEGSPNGVQHQAMLAELPGDADIVVTIGGDLLSQVNATEPGLGLEGFGYAQSLHKGGRAAVKASESGRRFMLAKFEEGRTLARTGLTAARASIDTLALAEGLGVLYADRHFDDLARKLTPIEKGDLLVVEFPAASDGTLIATAGVMAAVAVPAFIKYVRRAKTTEAVDEIDKIYKGAAVYFMTPKVGADGTRLPCQFPASTGPTPAGSCCNAKGGPDRDGDDRCDVDPNAWNTPTWSALSFQMADQHYFVYTFESSGTGSAAKFAVSAYADLDCDGVMSTFQRLGFADPAMTDGDCALQGQAAFYVENETE